MINYFLIIFFSCIINANAYRNKLFTVVRNPNPEDIQCRLQALKSTAQLSNSNMKLSYKMVPSTTELTIDPFLKFQKSINRLLFGSVVDGEYDAKISELSGRIHEDMLAQRPSGAIMRGELFNNKSMVHLPFSEYMHRGHIYLRETRDYMQTAVNAFSIFLKGDLKDILRLPPEYVLRSSRTIAMMKIAREKLAATWTIVKDHLLPEEVSHETLQMYRPLFRYVNGREMARLNISDNRIINYIGTHPDLGRHQVAIPRLDMCWLDVVLDNIIVNVLIAKDTRNRAKWRKKIGIVAKAYIELNQNWRESRYLNQMNNLICGVPMYMMRSISENTFLQLTHQIFYHIRACDPLQKRFLLGMMTRAKVLGKPYSWSARDVSRLGLLLTVMGDSEMGAIKPKAMSGITSDVMAELPQNIIKSITEAQIEYIKPKALNILARKLKKYNDEMLVNKSPPMFGIFGNVIMYLVVIKLGYYSFPLFISIAYST